MKKTFLLLFSLLVIVVAYGLEGGSLQAVFIPTAIIPLLTCTLLGTMFSFQLSEIGDAFQDAFTANIKTGQIAQYQMDRLVIQNISSSLVFWTISIVLLGIVNVLSHLGDLSKLGQGLAVVFTALIFGFALKALLLIPMDNSISKKLLLAEKSQPHVPVESLH